MAANDDDVFEGKDVPVEIYTDEDGSESVPQTQFIDSLVESLTQYTNNNKVIVKDVRQNHIVVETDEGTHNVNISDDDDPELMMLAFVLVGAFNYSAPKIVFNLTFKDDTEELVIDSTSLADFSGVLFTSMTNIPKSDYSLEVGCRYLFNRLRKLGIFSFSFTDDATKDRMNVDSILMFTDSEDLSDETVAKMEAAAVTVGSVARDDRARLKRLKRIKMNRLKDPAAYRQRSKAMKLSWRRDRQSRLQGMRKFHRSVRGKRIDRMRGRKLAIKAKMGK